MTGAFDEAAVRSAAEARAKIQIELEVSHAKMMSQVAGVLTAEQKASFSLRFNGQTQFETPNLNAALPSGTVSQALSLRTPNKFGFINALLDYAPTKNQTLRFSYTEQDNTSDNVGIGAYDLPERAFSNRFANRSFRVQEVGPIGFLLHLFAPKGETTGFLKILMAIVFFAVGFLEVFSILFRGCNCGTPPGSHRRAGRRSRPGRPATNSSS